MAIIPLHKLLTKRGLEEFGFSESAQEIAARANAKVDDKQGSLAIEANLHAMRGRVGAEVAGTGVMRLPSTRMQSEQEAREAVNALLAAARQQVATHLLAHEYRDALKALGAALHTIQDREYHRHEPWEHAGILQAILHDPNYMFAHGLRDLGAIGSVPFGISRFDTARSTPSRPRFDFEISFPVAHDAWISLGGYTAGREASPFPGGSGLGSDVGGMVTFTIGQTPRVEPPRDTSQPTRTPPVTETSIIATAGTAAYSSAVSATRGYIRDVRRYVNERDADTRSQLSMRSAWEEFVSTTDP